MPLFDELVADLIKENLLDEVKIVNREPRNSNDFAKFSDTSDILSLSQPDFLIRSETYELKLPEFSFLEPEFILPPFEEQQNQNTKTIVPEPNTFEDDQILIKQEKLRRLVQKPKAKKNRKLCPTCQYNISPLSIHCRFCKTRVISDLTFYLLIMFAVIIFMAVILKILSDKTIN